MLMRLRMPVEDCLEEYRNLGTLVFGDPRHIHQAGPVGLLSKRNKFSTTTLETAIKDVIRRRGETRRSEQTPEGASINGHDDAMLFNTPRGLCRG